MFFSYSSGMYLEGTNILKALFLQSIVLFMPL